MRLMNPRLGEKVGKLETFAYGCGEVSTCAVFSLATTLLVLFYTDYVGISPRNRWHNHRHISAV